MMKELEGKGSLGIRSTSTTCGLSLQHCAAASSSKESND
jgi:hypothetical protein